MSRRSLEIKLAELRDLLDLPSIIPTPATQAAVRGLPAVPFREEVINVITLAREEVRRLNLLADLEAKLARDELESAEGVHPLVKVVVELAEAVVEEELPALPRGYVEGYEREVQRVLRRWELYTGEASATFPTPVKEWASGLGAVENHWDSRPMDYVRYLLWDEISAFVRMRHPKQRSLPQVLRAGSTIAQPHVLLVEGDSAIQWSVSRDYFRYLRFIPWRSVIPYGIDRLGLIKKVYASRVYNCQVVMVKRGDDFWMLHITPNFLMGGLSGAGVAVGFQGYDYLLAKHYKRAEDKALGLGLVPGDSIEVVGVFNSCSRIGNFSPKEFSDFLMRGLDGTVEIKSITVVDVKLPPLSYRESRLFYVSFDIFTGNVEVVPDGGGIEDVVVHSGLWTDYRPSLAKGATLFSRGYSGREKPPTEAAADASAASAVGAGVAGAPAPAPSLFSK